MPITALHVPSLPEDQEDARARRMALSLVQNLRPDLSGLTVYTEAATGPYRYTACIAALAGARVYALAQDSPWGSIEAIAAEQARIARQWAVPAPHIVVEKEAREIGLADIVTNSGNVRPLDAQTISWMHSRAVIPLMWETYEWRPDELDLQACKERGILVMGTDETRMGFLDFVPETLVKLLHSAGIALRGGRFLYLATGPITHAVARQFAALGAEVRTSAWQERRQEPYFLSPHSAEFLPYVQRCDAIICDERFDQRPLLGEGGLISVSCLAEHCHGAVVVNRHGVLDTQALRQAGIQCVPDDRPVPWNKPRATTAILGLRPTMELVIAGLKVGEVMARLRRRNVSVADTAQEALRRTFAQDFAPPHNWIPCEHRHA